MDTVDQKFSLLGPPGTPYTTPEIAEEFDCSDRTIYSRLKGLVATSHIETKKVGAKGRGWWQPLDDAAKRIDPHSHNFNQFPLSQTPREMADRIREYEWDETPLDAIRGWPPELRVAVDIMLGVSEVIGTYWGDDLRLLYNDATIKQIGEKHRDALGQPACDVFPEAWDKLGPM